MKASSPTSDYALGSAEAEHQRLIRQAALLAPLTERFLRDAGIASGQRVLDLGSGVGDVAMLAGRIVGPSGEVVGVERDSRSIARARARVAEAGQNHVSFTESDVVTIPVGKPFDAAVGRFILMFVPDPVAVVRVASKAVRPGGAVAFQESSWSHFLLASAGLPLWSAAASLARDVLERSGANVETGFALNRIFQGAGLPAPIMKMEVTLGSDPDSSRWLYDFLSTLRPQVQKQGLSLEPLGDFDTLPLRLHAEVTASRAVVPVVGTLVGAWCHTPRSAREKETRNG